MRRWPLCLSHWPSMSMAAEERGAKRPLVCFSPLFEYQISFKRFGEIRNHLHDLPMRSGISQTHRMSAWARSCHGRWGTISEPVCDCASFCTATY